MTALSTQPYKGTRDFYPNDMRFRRWMFDTIRKTLINRGYEEYDGPMLEPFELYAAKTSEEIVNEQLYWLVDRGERKLAIRPEMTPTLARLVAAKQNELPRPIRLFSIPNLWRYERPQRGRLREHWQLNVDVFGGNALAEDLEICLMTVDLLQGFGAKSGFEIRMNHRGITNHVFEKILQLKPEQITLVARTLDAAHKMKLEDYIEDLKKHGLLANQIDTMCKLIEKSTPNFLRDALKNEENFHHISSLLDKLQSLGVGNFFRFDPSIMRGFMYYTGMVLEVYNTHPENNRAMFGGGRYDNLVGMFGGSPLPGVGFGMGDVTLENFLRTHNLVPDLLKPQGIYVAYLEDNLVGEAQQVARKLRELAQKANQTITITTALESQKPKKVFTSAEKLSLASAIFVGQDEVKTQNFSYKNLVTKEQFQGSLEDILKKHLSKA